MSSRVWSAAIVAVAALASSVEARVALVEKPGHVTAVSIVVDAPPQQVYDQLTDFPHWRSLFSDVLSLEVRPGGREHAQVRFKSHALDRWVTVQFDNVPGQLIRFKNVDNPLGTRARGEWRLSPIDGGTRTQITAWVYLDVVGAPGLFVRSKTIRGFRQAKLAVDASDVKRRFTRT
jgi:uncharacterized protein YndB with AHSA1/START domain